MANPDQFWRSFAEYIIKNKSGTFKIVCKKFDTKGTNLFQCNGTRVLVFIFIFAQKEQVYSNAMVQGFEPPCGIPQYC